MSTINHKNAYRLSAVVVSVVTVGCSVIKPTPEAEALNDTRAWGAGSAPPPEEQYPDANSIASSLRGFTRP
jgi:hypothetical protein